MPIVIINYTADEIGELVRLNLQERLGFPVSSSKMKRLGDGGYDFKCLPEEVFRLKTERKTILEDLEKNVESLKVKLTGED